MALGTTVDFQINCDKSAGASFPSSVTSKWANVIDAGGCVTADAATITNPTSEITASTRKLARRGVKAGTLLMLRAAYPTAETITTALKVKVFGRVSGSTDAWQPLYNKESTPALQTTFDDATTDVTDGTSKFTTPSVNHTIDCQGCDEFLIGVEQGAVTSSANQASMYLQAKII